MRDMLAAIYTRFSTDRQRDASIEDQLRQCRRRADAEGWTVVSQYADHAMSGSRSDRPDYAKMLADAMAGHWKLLLVEDLSRLSRDQVEAERTIRRLEHRGVVIIGVSDGYDSRSSARKVHRGVRNLLNEVYLDDLRAKTHRGLEGQARRGFNTGGRCYGYRHVPIEDPTLLDSFGRPVVVAVKREIDPDQAQWVHWIFQHYVDGWSPGRMAGELNRLGVPSLRGGTWASSAIYGCPNKGTGILRNPLYAGRYRWNRSEWLKDPDTGVRQRRERDESEWVWTEVPELRIIEPALWDAAQALVKPKWKLTRRDRGRHLFSGLLKCGICGGPLTIIGNQRYGCSWHKHRGDAVCSNGRSVNRDRVESALLDTVRGDLVTPEAFDEFNRECRRLLAEAGTDFVEETAEYRDRLVEVEKTIANLIRAISAGTFSPTLQQALESAELERAELKTKIQQGTQKPQIPEFLPRAQEIYADLVKDLDENLREDVDEARRSLRAILGDEIRVYPYGKRGLAAEVSASNFTLKVVAGAGFEPTTFGL